MTSHTASPPPTEASTLQPTPRTTLKRGAQRACYDRAALHAILDEGLVCHLAFAADGVPHVIPTAYARVDDTVYVHGAAGNRVLRALATGGDACLSVTLVDGLVLARSAFHTSMNYRSAILYGPMRDVAEPEEKLAGLRAIVEHAIPGRWSDVRGPNDAEFGRTRVLALPIEEASAKIRVGQPVEDEEDYALGCWAGVIPLETRTTAPIPDPRLRADIAPPRYVTSYRRPVKEDQP